MKEKVIRPIKQIALLMLLFFVGYSCSDDPVQDFESLNKEVYIFEVKESDWTWDDGYKGYIATMNFPQLTKNIYNDGAQIASVFIGTENKDELQKPLPYVHTYPLIDDQGQPVLDDDENPVTFTETISCDYQVFPSSSIAFYIQGSDLQSDDYSSSNYFFRVVLIW